VDDEDYVALFCPHCGVHLNDFDEQDDGDLDSVRPLNLGSMYTCGWCKKQTRDWNHVKQCKRTWPLRQHMLRQALESEVEGAVVRLNRMLDDLKDDQTT